MINYINTTVWVYVYKLCSICISFITIARRYIFNINKSYTQHRENILIDRFIWTVLVVCCLELVRFVYLLLSGQPSQYNLNWNCWSTNTHNNWKQDDHVKLDEFEVFAELAKTSPLSSRLKTFYFTICERGNCLYNYKKLCL